MGARFKRFNFLLNIYPFAPGYKSKLFNNPLLPLLFEALPAELAERTAFLLKKQLCLNISRMIIITSTRF